MATKETTACPAPGGAEEPAIASLAPPHAKTRNATSLTEALREPLPLKILWYRP